MVVNFYISTHYMPEQIQEYFGDGSDLVEIFADEICHTFENEGVYNIQIVLERYSSDSTVCIEKDTILEVNIEDCMNAPPCLVDDLEIFNAITPNNDGLNDQLIISGASGCARDIKIFNRWGQMVWSEKGYVNTWSGESHTGEKLPDGTYFLIVEFPQEDAKERQRLQTFIDIRSD